MKFEIGKYYKHNGGEKLFICDSIETIIYGKGLIAEKSNGDFYVVGESEENAVNYVEIKQEEYSNEMRNTSVDSDIKALKIGTTYYDHDLELVHIVKAIQSFHFGKCLIAERTNGELFRLKNYRNYVETTKNKFNKFNL